MRIFISRYKYKFMSNLEYRLWYIVSINEDIYIVKEFNFKENYAIVLFTNRTIEKQCLIIYLYNIHFFCFWQIIFIHFWNIHTLQNNTSL